MRIINEILKNARRARGWSYADEAAATDGELLVETLEQHDENDSSNAHTIARKLEIYFSKPYPTRPSKWFLNGQINRELKAEALDAGLDHNDIARTANSRLKLGLDGQGVRKLAEQVRNVLRGLSRDSYIIALINFILGKPTMPPHTFLKAPDSKPKQLKLVFGEAIL